MTDKQILPIRVSDFTADTMRLTGEETGAFI
jgi:hypothetical protein